MGILPYPSMNVKRKIGQYKKKKRKKRKENKKRCIPFLFCSRPLYADLIRISRDHYTIKKTSMISPA